MGTVVYANVNGQLLSETRDGVRKLYSLDPLESTRALYDSTLTRTDTFHYFPSGTVSSRTGTTPTPFQWVGGQGYYRDNAKRVHVRARNFYVNLGRWAETDPIGFKGGDYNLYRYVKNRFVIRIDPTGLFEQTHCVPLDSEFTVETSAPKLAASRFIQGITSAFSLPAPVVKITKTVSGKGCTKVCGGIRKYGLSYTMSNQFELSWKVPVPTCFTPLMPLPIATFLKAKGECYVEGKGGIKVDYAQVNQDICSGCTEFSMTMQGAVGAEFGWESGRQEAGRQKEGEQGPSCRAFVSISGGAQVTYTATSKQCRPPITTSQWTGCVFANGSAGFECGWWKMKTGIEWTSCPEQT